MDSDHKKRKSDLFDDLTAEGLDRVRRCLQARWTGSSDLEDAVQEACLHALKKGREHFCAAAKSEAEEKNKDVEDILIGKLFLDAHNFMRNWYRKEKKASEKREAIAYEKERPSELPESTAIRHEGSLKLSAYLNQLKNHNSNQFTVFCMRHIEGLSNTDTATRLGMSDQSASQMYHRALAYLRQQIAKDK